MDGWLNIFKPKGLTSFDVIRKLRKILNTKKIGHAGTLDPMAEGVLPIALGKATKTIPYMMDREKTYQFEITWGIQTDSEDLEGNILNEDQNFPKEDEIKKALPNFIGEIQQVPPIYSACKIDGQRAYKLAREGKEVNLKPKTVFVKSFDLLSNNNHKSMFRVTCGKGTYIRSLSRDLAQILNKFGTVSILIREKVGPFTLDKSIKLEDIPSLLTDPSCIMTLIHPVGYVLDDIPAYTLSQDEYEAATHGRTLQTSSGASGIVSLKWMNTIIGIASAENKVLHPKKIWR